jgi:hypothetical protein
MISEKKQLKIIIIIVVSLIVLFFLHDAVHAHENEKWKHQTESIMRYGEKSIGYSERRIYTNAEQTLCRDLLFSEGQFHYTEEFPCDAKMRKTEGE